MPAARYAFVVSELRSHTSVGSRTLEIGCGAQPYRDAVRGKYVGVDLPWSQHLEGSQPTVAADAQRLPFRDRSFDLVFGVATFYLVSDAAAALAECQRVLAPGGALILFDYDRGTCERFLELGTTPRVWDWNVLRAMLVGAGFERRAIRNISKIVDWDLNPSLPRFLVRRALRWCGRPNTWLIVRAQRFG